MIKNDELIGQVFKNNSDQRYKVLNRETINKSGNIKYRIKFLDTGYEKLVEKVEMKRGKIKDKLAKSVFGIGILGEIKMVNYKREYSVWSGMLERCYDKRFHSYRSYGGRGVTVCERWHTFANFLKDISLIEGYDKEKFKNGEIFLDKDTKQKGVLHKVYSLETCKFVSMQENNAAIDYTDRKKSFYALSPNGKLIQVHGLREFAKNNNLTRQRITSILNKKGYIHKGWKFSYRKEDLLNEIA